MKAKSIPKCKAATNGMERHLAKRRKKSPEVEEASARLDERRSISRNGREGVLRNRKGKIYGWLNRLLEVR